ncbi:complement C3-like isoform X2 [Takifugu rubripes]|uniref:complement C3-like isoform X2 n=1 Tax=Takifugu rubripes TaxID=31033 RepID=UPI001145436D|nr:complement C3-like isoform X2 [Takifugu rubripes]
MEKPERICPILLLLFFTSFLPPTDGSPLEVLAAPNAIRAGMPENIFVEVQDFSLDTNIPVEIIVMNHPTKSKRLASTAVNLNRANSHQAFGEVLIPAEAFNNYDNSQHYVYLQAVFPERMLEKVVLVSFQTEYLFIQIAKNMYTPESRVHFRIFAMMPDFSYRANPNPLHIEIVNSEGHFPVNSIVLEPPGMYQGDIRIPENASPGLWNIKATYSNNPRLSCSAEFEVKEYVVPSLSIQLTPESMFFYEDEDKITVNINARYLFGEEVDGVAFVLFGIQHVGQKKPIPSSLQRVSIVRGKGAAVLQRRKITEAFGPLTGYSMYVKVTVLTESGGDMVVSEFNGIKIVKSPYTINLDKATKNFKPGIPYDLEFQVLNLDGTPAKLVVVSVEPGSMLVRTGDNGFAKLPINTEENAPKLTITIKTSHDALAPDKQATATFEVLPYSSPTKTYIHIVANTADLKLGDNLGVHCFLKRQEYAPAMITYLILSKGRLVKHSRRQLNYQMVISENILVTKEMMPSFTIIVYYHTSNNEVVSDSVRVDIKDTCIGSLQLEKLRVDPSHEPRKSLPVKITGTPGATVGLVVIHKDVYTDKWRLTQKKIWDEVKKKDRYCPLGGEYNSMRVFYEAGLLFESNIGSTPYRQDLRCPSCNRKKRSDDIGDNMNSSMDVEDIVSRSIFPKSWMWLSVVLPPCPGNDPYCKTTSKTIPNPLKDSITNWEITGISLSRTHGICVADPLEVIVRKDFFIDLKAPYSAIAGEQLEIKAVLHNYTPDHITVLVHLFEEENVCSAAYGRRTYQQEVIVGAMSSRSVSLVFIFTKEGLSNIHVKAAVKDSFLNDGVMKMIYVVPWGELVKHTMTVTLDPARKGVDGRQTEVLQSQIPAHAMLPSTPAATVVYITGMASIQAENVISGDNMSYLLIQPLGNGETNIIPLTMTVIATTYLDKTNQWEKVGFNKRSEALGYINDGYSNQLVNRKSDGSFSLNQNKPSSTWLTAFVVKVFTMASSLVSVQSRIICDAVKFLNLQQQPDGQFREVGRLTNREMPDDVFGADSDASMTSFCLIALQESRPLCAFSINSLRRSIYKAVGYLERRLPGLSNPYAVAMASYALANENRLNKETLKRFASPGLDHWPVSKGLIYQLEATSYALLALVRAGAFAEAQPVVSWLKEQKRIRGAYLSTQANLMVYQAVAEYFTRVKEGEKNVQNLDVDILLPDRLTPARFSFNRQNFHLTRSSKINSINRPVRVTATGKGQGVLKMVSLYYTSPKQMERNCQKFNLSVQLIPQSVREDEKVYKLRIDVLYLSKDQEATMSVLDIGLLTGFTVDTNDLDSLSKGRGRTISNYETGRVLSDRGSLIIYLDKVSHTQPVEISFRIREVLRSAILQPAAVSVYEHKDQTSCVKFYHPARVAGQLMRLCTGNECKCAEEGCGILKRDTVNNEQRLEWPCEVSRRTRTDFVYKVRVDEISRDLSMDVYTMTILEVIRESSYDENPSGESRSFLSFAHCRDNLNLVTGKTYLIMGESKQIYRHDAQQSYQYIIGQQTWLEYWPTDAECQSDQHRPTCLGLDDLVSQQVIFGCVE